MKAERIKCVNDKGKVVRVPAKLINNLKWMKKHNLVIQEQGEQPLAQDTIPELVDINKEPPPEPVVQEPAKPEEKPAEYAFNTKEMRQRIKELGTIEDVEALCMGDERKTVITARDKRISELKTK